MGFEVLTILISGKAERLDQTTHHQSPETSIAPCTQADYLAPTPFQELIDKEVDRVRPMMGTDIDQGCFPRALAVLRAVEGRDEWVI